VSVASNPLHIARASVDTSSNMGSHCGTRAQPWLLEAPAGQKIKISLLNFTPDVASTASYSSTLNATRTHHISSSSSCGRLSQTHQYGYIIDKSATSVNKKNVSICGHSTHEKVTDVYLSASSVIELVTSQPSVHHNASGFLLRVEC
jgi:hypothetical protein